MSLLGDLNAPSIHVLGRVKPGGAASIAVAGCHLFFALTPPASRDIFCQTSCFCSLNLNLDDALFQRLVESRWEGDYGSDGGGLDLDGFVRLFGTVLAPAITYGRHLRKAAGRGDEELGENPDPWGE